MSETTFSEKAGEAIRVLRALLVPEPEGISWQDRVFGLNKLLTLREIGEVSGLSISSVSDLKHGKTKVPEASAAVRLYELYVAHAPEISALVGDPAPVSAGGPVQRKSARSRAKGRRSVGR